jgi:hypothetical protein
MDTIDDIDEDEAFINELMALHPNDDDIIVEDLEAIEATNNDDDVMPNVQDTENNNDSDGVR